MLQEVLFLGNVLAENVGQCDRKLKDTGDCFWLGDGILLAEIRVLVR